MAELVAATVLFITTKKINDANYFFCLTILRNSGRLLRDVEAAEDGHNFLKNGLN